MTPQTPPPANGMAAMPAAPVDSVLVVNHLTSLIRVSLGATNDELEAPGSLLSKSKYSETLQRCSRFANDVQAALFIRKDLVSDEPHTTNGDDASDGPSMLLLPRTCPLPPLFGDAQG